MASREAEDQRGGERPLWFVDGKAYDLTPFTPYHPGGAVWHGMPGRDHSVSFHTYHKDPKKLLPILMRYLVDLPGAQPEKKFFPKTALFQVPDFDAATCRPGTSTRTTRTSF